MTARHFQPRVLALSLLMTPVLTAYQDLHASVMGLDPSFSLETDSNYSLGSPTPQLETGTTGNAGLVGSSSLISNNQKDNGNSQVFSEDEEISISRKDLDDEGSTVVEPRAVLTKKDLEAYAKSELYADPQLESLKFTEERVELRYRESGKFLALMSVPLTVHATAKANGDISVEYPWYSLLTIDHKSEVETEMRVVVNNAIHSRQMGTVKAQEDPKHPKFSFSEAADVASHIHEALKINF